MSAGGRGGGRFDDTALAELARESGERLLALGISLAAAESCTGGWLAKSATDLPGSSRWFERGFVTYSNDSKQELLGVKAETLARAGAVSEAVVREMVLGALDRSRAGAAVAITGIAGPGGGSAGKPVGLVWFAWARRGAPPVARHANLEGEREAIRRQAVRLAWEGLLDLTAERHG